MGDLSWPLARAAQLHGARTAVRDGDRTVTYAELARQVDALGAALPAGHIGVLAANSLPHLECWLAIPAHGRVIVDLNHRLAPEELAFIAEDAGLELLLADAERLPVARTIASCPVLDIEHAPRVVPQPPPDHAPDTLAAISYTGGTTGTPKGVMLSHGNLVANALHNLVATGHSAEDRWLHVCPMFHVAGTANVIACTWVGAEQVILPRFDPEAVATTIERERITHTVLVPTMLALLLDHLEEHPADLSSLRHVQYAASPISPALQRRVLDTLDCDVAQFYGMTEAAPTVTHCTPGDHRRGRKLDSVGAPVAGVQVEIRSLDGGPVGEICVRGPNVMLGYWNRPEATAEALVDGWYRTGDAGRMDSDGYVYLVDRLKDMMVTGGENVYSIEVESALASHDGVLEAAVFGIPDDAWGERVHAVVALRPGAKVTEEELVAHCRGRIAGFKLPRSIELRDEPLPKSGAGKLLKHVLREQRATPRSHDSDSLVRRST